MKLDYLHGTPYEIEQPDNFYHFNSDTELLGKFLIIDNEDTVLDIGTNTGALLLYASLNDPRELVGVDLYDEVLEVARKNMEHNHIEATFYTSKIQEFNNGKYTKIICNPPYFNSLKEKEENNPYHMAARHQQFLPINDLVSAINRLLTTNGSVQMVYRYDLVDNLLKEFEKCDFYPIRCRVVYDKLFGNKKTILLELRKGYVNSVKILPVAYQNDRNTF